MMFVYCIPFPVVWSDLGPEFGEKLVVPSVNAAP